MMKMFTALSVCFLCVVGCSIPDDDDVARAMGPYRSTSPFDRPIMIRTAQDFLKGQDKKDKIIGVECRPKKKSADGTSWDVDNSQNWESPEALTGYQAKERFVNVALFLLCLGSDKLYTECGDELGKSAEQRTLEDAEKQDALLAKFIGMPTAARKFECRWGYAKGYHPNEIDKKSIDPNSISERDRFVEFMRGPGPALGVAACSIEEMVIIDGIATCLKLCPLSTDPGCPNSPTDIFDGTTFEQSSGTVGDP